ncbi:Uncharacterized protein FWK35_00016518 [Aphis craccivora]|uniref:Uncharacterized protein n=2 Tax=Aphis craccivora TaxID=307492 RepID=A0A6G0Z2C0_APHCR|nr:Uncharacterized protein FWK35_00016518 [Aphis craccivora]
MVLKDISFSIFCSQSCWNRSAIPLHFSVIISDVLITNVKQLLLDSERSNDCIDFTMLCVFFVCLCTRERVEIMLQFQTLGVVSDSEMNLVGALGRSFFEIPNTPGKTKIIKEKREFLRKTSFRPNRFFYMVVIQKLITVNI